MTILKWAGAMLSFVLILGTPSEFPVFLPAITLWLFAYLIGKASRPREEPPEVRITVEEVDLEFHEYYPFLNPDHREPSRENREAFDKAMRFPALS